MRPIKDKYGKILNTGDWVRLISGDYNGDYIGTTISQITKLNEYFVSLKSGNHISDGEKLHRVDCLELMTDEEEIMLAILENA